MVSTNFLAFLWSEPDRSRTGAGQEPDRSRTGAGQEPDRSRNRTGAGQEPDRSRNRTGTGQEPDRSRTGAGTIVVVGGEMVLHGFPSSQHELTVGWGPKSI
jgi:hypothetical protein